MADSLESASDMRESLPIRPAEPTEDAPHRASMANGVAASNAPAHDPTKDTKQHAQLAHDTSKDTKHALHQHTSSAPPTIADEARPPSSLPRPGAIQINVEGAFIVDEDGSGGSPSRRTHSPEDEGVSDEEMGAAPHDMKDIRLPNHTKTVSHVAVDIGGSLIKLVYFSPETDTPQLGGRLNFFKWETDRIDEVFAFLRRLQRKHTRLARASSATADERLCIMATGGGAFKYYDAMRQQLGVEVMREDEMECLIMGLDFFITEIPNEVFTHDDDGPPVTSLDTSSGTSPNTTTSSAAPAPAKGRPGATGTPRSQFLPPRPAPLIYPYLLVNIGSGVSMIKVSGPRDFHRIGGTSLGGGTLWGLLSLITGARSFDEMLALADRGDNAAVDMLVGDIYGEGYSKLGLRAEHIASSFGKVYRMKRQAERAAEDDGGGGAHLRDRDRVGEDGGGGFASPSSSTDHYRTNGLDGQHDDDAAAANDRFSAAAAATQQQQQQQQHTATDPSLHEPDAEEPPRSFKPEDVSRSLLYAVSYNIGQIAYLQSCKHNLAQIYFGGSFIRGHAQTMGTLSYAIRFWSDGEKQAFFLRHEGYLGAVGAFLKRKGRGWGRRGSVDGGGGGGEELGRWLSNEHVEGERTL